MNLTLEEHEIPEHLKQYFEPIESKLKSKQLASIPWRVAFALQADGWYLRSDIIWSKKNCMPESVTDRPTKAHEYLFMLAKSERYWYDQDAIREPHNTKIQTYNTNAFSDARYHQWKNNRISGIRNRQKYSNKVQGNPAGRNKRTVWHLATKPYKEAHFAVMPEALVEPCLLAGCPAQVCGECGEPWVRQTLDDRHITKDGKCSGCGENILKHAIGNKNLSNPEQGINPPYFEYKNKLVKICSTKRTLGFTPTCQCSAPTRPGVALDPFFGSGTVGVVSKKLKRDWLGIELNPKYVELARKRLNETQPALFALT